MFDLPTGTRFERKAANGFRHDLLDMGFEMAQFSVYAKFCGGEPRRRAILTKVKEALPEEGKVDILTFTDKQYESIVRFENNTPTEISSRPRQFLLLWKKISFLNQIFT